MSFFCPFCRYEVPAGFIRIVLAHGILEPEHARSQLLMRAGAFTPSDDERLVTSLNNAGPDRVDIDAQDLIAIMMAEGQGLGFFDYPRRLDKALGSDELVLRACAACLDGEPYPEGFGPSPEPPVTPHDP